MKREASHVFNQHPIRAIMAVLLVGITMIFTACSSDDAATPTDQSYSGPGSKWDVTLKVDGTFAIDKYTDAADTTVDFGFTGTYTRLTTGFKKLTVGAVTGTGGPSVGDVAYGLEVPGFVFALKPAGGGDQVIPMVASGTCPSTDINANWVKVNMRDGLSDFVNTDTAGKFNYNATTGAATLPDRYKVGGGSLGSNTVGTGTCANGVMTIGNVEMYLTSNGGAAVNTDNSNSASAEFLFAFGQSAISDINSLDGTYAGLMIDESKSAGSHIEPIKIVCSAGTCTGQGYTDIETGAVINGGVSITLNSADSPATGFVTATVTEGSVTSPLICMFDKNAVGSGKTIGSCAGEGAGGSRAMFNVLFVSI